jgi:hypothetical protein
MKPYSSRFFGAHVGAGIRRSRGLPAQQQVEETGHVFEYLTRILTVQVGSRQRLPDLDRDLEQSISIRLGLAGFIRLVLARVAWSPGVADHPPSEDLRR